MDLVKRISNIGKNAVVGTALVGMLALGACRGDNPSPPPNSPNPPTANQAPETTITKDFGDGLTGMVDYTVCGTDSDGYVDNTETWENGTGYFQYINPSQINPFCETFEVPIIEGTNTLEARANDNDGLRDPTIAEEVFYSPIEAEARTKIDGILNARGYVEGVDYEKDQFMIVNEDIFKVDYWFRNPDNSTRGVMTYISHQDNLINESFYKSRIDDALIQNLYLARIPLDFLESETNNFLDQL